MGGARLRTIIVDDESAARDSLRHLLAECRQISIVGETEYLDDTLDSINRLNPDLLFLDVELRDKTAFDLLEMLQDPILFRIIFTTGFNKYAVRAFDHAAIDYLLKPIDPVRLQEAIKRVKKNIDLSIIGEQIARLRSCINKGKLKITTRHKNTIELINKDEIVYCRADGNYSEIYLTGNRQKLITSNLRNLEDNLTEECFIRLGREFIINAEFLTRLVKSEKKCFLQRDDEEIELNIPGRQLKSFEEMLGYLM